MTNKLLDIEIPSCNSELILHSVEGREAISELFKFTLQVTAKDVLKQEQLIGKKISIQISYGGQKRYFHGIINEFSVAYDSFVAESRYHISMVPWLWFLTQEKNCRIFQHKTVLEIIETVFKEYNYKSYDFSRVSGAAKQNKRDYCVQYQETTFDFVSRVLEEEGVFYYFNHSKQEHKLLLSDSSRTCPHQSAAYYQSGSAAENVLNHWQRNYQFRSNLVTQLDYNFTTPNTELLSKATPAKVQTQPQCELFTYPGNNARIQAEQLAAAYEVGGGNGNYLEFAAGSCFSLNSHEQPQEQGIYLLLSVQHLANVAIGYHNSFAAIPAAVTYRPPCKTPRPFVLGVESAKVVTSGAEERYVDQYGRIKVQFHWDRKGKNNEYSSCWLRVVHASYNQFVPQGGEEVLVAFKNGNPDHPIVIGCLYNAQHSPQYSLPVNKYQSGIKTSSNNDLRFDDRVGAEEIYMHAQKNFTTEVKNGKFSLQAAEAIELKVGGNSIVITGAGIIEHGPKLET